MGTPDFSGPDGVWSASDNMSFLRPALRGWVAVNRRFCRVRCSVESIYWCNERANVGALAAGSWREGMVALEEYPHERGKPDLYLTDLENEHEVVIEAKLHWWEDRGDEKTQTEDVRKLLNDACEQAKGRSERNGAILKLGAVFVVPSLGKVGKFSHAAIIGTIFGALRPQLIAWYFDDENKHLQWQEDGRYYPGVVLILSKAS